MKFKFVTGVSVAALSAVAWFGMATINDNSSDTNAQASATVIESTTAKATFAGGCFWCMEPPFDDMDGVISTISGYAGGHVANPTYRQVSSGKTGHTEVIQITYDPRKVTYEELLATMWPNIDPTDAGGQFCDRGSQYRSEIFYHNEAQKIAAEKSRAELEKNKPFKADIVTEISKMTQFYPAEDYHQDYYIKNPIRYKFYRTGCGRDRRLNDLWDD